MNKEKIGQEVAFPSGFQNNENRGISKRFYAACAAMQGILATSSGLFIDDKQLSLNKQSNIVIKIAYLYADELLEQEDEQ